MSAWVREHCERLREKNLRAHGFQLPSSNPGRSQQMAKRRKAKSRARPGLAFGQVNDENPMGGGFGKVTKPKFVAPSSIRLSFADGLEGTWTFAQLCLDMETMRPESIRATRAGASVKLRSRWNEIVEIDSSTLRAAIDSKYSEKLEVCIPQACAGLSNIYLRTRQVVIQKEHVQQIWRIRR